MPEQAQLPALRLTAPAKLNLYLAVRHKRSDGYHELDTLFECIDLADELSLWPQPDTLELTCSDPDLSCDGSNLVLKAAQLLKETFSLPQAGARMHLTKRIPVAAGLGGGSSDAAATLLGLTQLWNIKADKELLIRLGQQLGADVPFFIEQAAFARGQGRGDVINRLKSSLTLHQVLVVPTIELRTGSIFAQGQIPLTEENSSISMLIQAIDNGSVSELAEGLYNALQPEAIRRCPTIRTLLGRLSDLGCLGCCVSGSGPSVFGICQDLQHAQQVQEQLQNELQGDVLTAQGTSYLRGIYVVSTDIHQHEP